jgi:hypothetical protein
LRTSAAAADAISADLAPPRDGRRPLLRQRYLRQAKLDHVEFARGRDLYAVRVLSAFADMTEQPGKLFTQYSPLLDAWENSA